jgi:hypothetical protein
MNYSENAYGACLKLVALGDYPLPFIYIESRGFLFAFAFSFRILELRFYLAHNQWVAQLLEKHIRAKNN